MSTRSLQFIRLQDVKGVRFVCKGSMSGAVLEVPINQLERAVQNWLQNNQCPVCRDEMWTTGSPGVKPATNPYALLAQCLTVLGSASDPKTDRKLEIEFVVAENASNDAPA